MDDEILINVGPTPETPVSTDEIRRHNERCTCTVLKPCDHLAALVHVMHGGGLFAGVAA